MPGTFPSLVVRALLFSVQNIGAVLTDMASESAER